MKIDLNFFTLLSCLLQAVNLSWEERKRSKHRVEIKRSAVMYNCMVAIDMLLKGNLKTCQWCLVKASFPANAKDIFQDTILMDSGENHLPACQSQKFTMPASILPHRSQALICSKTITFLLMRNFLPLVFGVSWWLKDSAVGWPLNWAHIKNIPEGKFLLLSHTGFLLPYL